TLWTVKGDTQQLRNDSQTKARRSPRRVRRVVAAARNAAGSAQEKARRPSPNGIARRALVEAAGIEPASADAPVRTSTSVVRAFDSTAGRGRTPYRRPSHPLGVATSGDWLSFGAEPVSGAATRATGPARSDVAT